MTVGERAARGSVGPPAVEPATLDSVAAAAGVSRATASRALTGSPQVSDEARQRVQAAARELAYVPNAAARSLVTRRSDAVAFVVCEPEEKFFSDPFFAAVLKGASRVVAEHQMQLVFTVVATDDDREQFARFVGGGHVGAVIFLSLHGAEPVLARVRTLGVPVVMAGRSLDPAAADLPHVDVDNLGGARAAVQHLVARGCRRIGTVSGPPDMAGATDRLRGWRTALEEAGIEAPASRAEAGDYTLEGGSKAMAALLAREADLDGVFVANDLMAVGALRALAAAGRRVPDDVAVAGFDDIPLAAMSTPALTTVRQPMEDLGRQLALTVLGDQQAGSTGPLPVALVVRESA